MYKRQEYYFPYFRGTGITTQEDVVIEKHAGKESYAGACDDVRIGVTIIFYLQNAGEYLTERSHGNYSRGSYAITLAALAKEGKILLPVTKDEKQEKEEKENTINRNRMIAAARNGDEEDVYKRQPHTPALPLLPIRPPSTLFPHIQYNQ